MVNSVGDSSNSSLLASVMQKAKTDQNIEMTLLKKSQDVEKAQGEAALKLIDSAASVSASTGIDVHV